MYWQQCSGQLNDHLQQDQLRPDYAKKKHMRTSAIRKCHDLTFDAVDRHFQEWFTVLYQIRGMFAKKKKVFSNRFAHKLDFLLRLYIDLTVQMGQWMPTTEICISPLVCRPTHDLFAVYGLHRITQQTDAILLHLISSIQCNTHPWANKVIIHCNEITGMQ